MTRLESRFRQNARTRHRGFIPYVTAGDPDLATSEAVILELAAAGATAIEVGVPFSDPIADGPVIQRACERALQSGATVEDILQMCKRVAARTAVPVVLFSYLNPLLAFGLERLAVRAKDSDISGVLVTDLPCEASAGFQYLLTSRGIDLIPLVAPTSHGARLRSIADRAAGFLYVVSRTGITGPRTADILASSALVSRVRQFTDLPIALGFGISSVEDARAAWRFADAVVIGSAIVRLIEESDSRSALLGRVLGFGGALACAAEHFSSVDQPCSFD